MYRYQIEFLLSSYIRSVSEKAVTSYEAWGHFILNFMG